MKDEYDASRTAGTLYAIVD